ncbi:MAG TPA: PAS domain-containing protein [Methanospirillum sp.]|nr:PAS domain-containing protein [Methanospirillum sp.]
MVIKKKEPKKKAELYISQNPGSLLDKAEKKLACSPPSNRPVLKGQTAEALIHELQVHQIELEIQAEELRLANLTIEKSRDQYFDLYEFAPLGYLTLTHTAVISQVNLTAATLIGVDRINLINAWIRIWIFPTDLEIWDRFFTSLISTEQKRTTTLMIKRGDGSSFPARLEGIRLTDSNEEITVRLAISDISDIRLAEKALQTSEERFQLALQNAPVSIAIQDKNLIFQWSYNQNLNLPIDVTGKRDSDIFLPDEAAHLIDLKRKSLETGMEINEKIWLTIEEERFFFDIYIKPLRDESRQVTGIGITCVDLTDQRVIEDALRQSEEELHRSLELLEAVTKGTGVRIAAQDLNFRYTYFNQTYQEEMKQLTGKDLIIGSSAIDLLADMTQEQNWAMDDWDRVLKGENISKRVEFGKPGESRRVHQILHTPIRNPRGIIIGSGEVAFDVTKQTLLDEKLIETKKNLDVTLSLLNASLESTADGIFVFDQYGKITGYNQNFVTMWNIPLVILESGEIMQVINYVLTQLKNPDDFSQCIEDSHYLTECESLDMLIFKNGKIFERYSKSQKIGDVVVGRVWSIRDVTDRKNAEEKLVASVQEKELLLREVHHRVKNNLQLISGLLDMTRMRTADESTSNILTDMMLKIQTMAQIHTRLFESKQFGRISIPDQIHVQLSELSNIYSHKGNDISYEVHSEEVFLPVDQALPCALAINEILSNVYKHAFKERSRGSITISVGTVSDQVCITIHDNGVGMPENLDYLSSNSLGLKLIKTLVQHQLKGTYGITNDSGTTVAIKFPIIPGEK